MASVEHSRHGDDLIGKVDEPDRWEALLQRVYRYTLWVRWITGELLRISLMVGVFSATVTISQPATAIKEVIHLLLR